MVADVGGVGVDHGLAVEQLVQHGRDARAAVGEHEPDAGEALVDLADQQVRHGAGRIEAEFQLRGLDARHGQSVAGLHRVTAGGVHGRVNERDGVSLVQFRVQRVELRVALVEAGLALGAVLAEAVDSACHRRGLAGVEEMQWDRRGQDRAGDAAAVHDVQ